MESHEVKTFRHGYLEIHKKTVTSLLTAFFILLGICLPELLLFQELFSCFHEEKKRVLCIQYTNGNLNELQGLISERCLIFYP